MTHDLAPALAEFFLSDEARVIRDPDALHGACVARWPAVTADEIARGIALARERVQAGAAEAPAGRAAQVAGRVDGDRVA